MLDELPDIGNIFNSKPINPNKNDENIEINTDDLINNEIYIYITKGDGKWLSATFIDLAPSGIGLHVFLPISIDFRASDFDKVKIRFKRKTNKELETIKDAPVLVRWQEKDPISGRLKIGLHFPGEVKSQPEIIEILKQLQNSK